MGEQLYFTLVHKWKYLIAIMKSKLHDSPNAIKKIVYVAREKDKDWIFGTKVKRLSKFSSLKASTHHHDKLCDLPEADGYFFIYQNYFCRCIRSTPSILKKKNIVMFTHPNWTKKYSKTHVVWCLNKADTVICLNSNIRDYLISSGVRPELLKVLHIGTSPSAFYPHKRGKGDVGFCSNYGDRKNPDLVLDIIKNLPDRRFHIIGRNWEEYDRYDELKRLPNLVYHNDVPYESYPDLYNKIDVFVSPSVLEGGPVPILEAMMSNCVIVASKTGFAPDLIAEGKNGYLFDVDATYNDVVPLIEKAFEIKGDVRQYVMPYTWENCSKTIDNYFLS